MEDDIFVHIADCIGSQPQAARGPLLRSVPQPLQTVLGDVSFGFRRSPSGNLGKHLLPRFGEKPRTHVFAKRNLRSLATSLFVLFLQNSPDELTGSALHLILDAASHDFEASLRQGCFAGHDASLPSAFSVTKFNLRCFVPRTPLVAVDVSHGLVWIMAVNS